jgi:hypothetical protein
MAMIANAVSRARSSSHSIIGISQETYKSRPLR